MRYCLNTGELFLFIDPIFNHILVEPVDVHVAMYSQPAPAMPVTGVEKPSQDEIRRTYSKHHHGPLEASVPREITELEKDLELAGLEDPDPDTTGSDSSECGRGDDDQVAPDGGLEAWLVVLGAWCASFCGYGWINSESFSAGFRRITPRKLTS